jgi:hypothetical protein
LRWCDDDGPTNVHILRATARTSCESIRFFFSPRCTDLRIRAHTHASTFHSRSSRSDRGPPPRMRHCSDFFRPFHTTNERHVTDLHALLAASLVFLYFICLRSTVGHWRNSPALLLTFSRARPHAHAPEVPLTAKGKRKGTRDAARLDSRRKQFALTRGSAGSP